VYNNILQTSIDSHIVVRIPDSIVTRSAHLPVRHPLRVCRSPGCSRSCHSRILYLEKVDEQPAIHGLLAVQSFRSKSIRKRLPTPLWWTKGVVERAYQSVEFYKKTLFFIKDKTIIDTNTW